MYYDKAAKQGDADALSKTAACYEHGVGVTQSYQEARRRYVLASAKGCAPAAEHLTNLDEKIEAVCPLLGKRVILVGTSREDLNGRAGTAASFDHAGGRYVVELDGTDGASEDKKEKLKIKPGNLAIKADRHRKGKKGKK